MKEESPEERRLRLHRVRVQRRREYFSILGPLLNSDQIFAQNVTYYQVLQ